MRIIFTYDIKEHALARGVPSDASTDELASELFHPSEANAILQTLKSLGHQVKVIDGAAEFKECVSDLARDNWFVFNEAKGLYGPDRKMLVPALCRVYGLPYLGSDAYGVTLARNKWHTGSIVRATGLAVPRSILIPAGTESRLEQWSSFPAIVKPNHESASIGISSHSVVQSTQTLIDRAKEIGSKYRQDVIVEEFILGSEVQVSVLGNSSDLLTGSVQLLVSGKESRPDFLVEKHDWRHDRIYFKRHKDASTVDQVESAARRVYRALGLRDYGRLDFRIDEFGVPFFIEAATHPHLVPGASFVKAFEEQVGDFEAVIAALLEVSFSRQGLT